MLTFYVKSMTNIQKKILLFSIGLFFCCYVFYLFGVRNYYLFIVIILFLIELTIRILHYKRDNNLIKKISKVRDLYLMSNPNLPYVYVPNVIVKSDNKPSFPIKIFDYEYPEQQIDSNGRTVVLENFKQTYKVENKFSIAFLGDSVIGSYLNYKKELYHIPYLVQSKLHDMDIFASVHNDSVGGYTIQDILVKFILKDIFDKASILVINCGYASIRSFLYKNYSHDNSHFRNNFDKFYYLMLLRNIIPDFGLYSIKYLYQQFLPSNSREDLLRYISKSGFDILTDEKQGIQFFFEHYQNMIYIAQSRGIKIILTTIPHYKYKNTFGHEKFSKIVSLLNVGIINLAIKNNLTCVDLDRTIKKSDMFFVDEAHLSHEGMLVASDEIAESIKLLYCKNN